MPAILPLPFEIAPPFSQTRVHTRWYKACVIRNKKAHCTLVNFCSFARTKGHVLGIVLVHFPNILLHDKITVSSPTSLKNVKRNRK